MIMNEFEKDALEAVHMQVTPKDHLIMGRF